MALPATASISPKKARSPGRTAFPISSPPPSITRTKTPTATVPDEINKISAIYAAHRIAEPQPDMTMSFVHNPPASVNSGAQFSIENTVGNIGAERANSAFIVNFQFVRDDPKAQKTFVPLGTRLVGGNMLEQASDSATTALTVPANITPGNYRLRVCADSTNTVPESNESNNCNETSIVTQVH